METAHEEELRRSRSDAADFVGRMHCVSLRANRRSPYKSLSEVRMLRSSSQRFRCLDFQETSFRTNAFSSLTFGDRRPFHRAYIAGRLAYGASWLSLDGLLVNADAEISSGRNENFERHQVANWGSFPLLQKGFLVIVIVAVAAAANKQRYLKEINCLQLAIDNRDKESAFLQKQMEHILEQLSFWKERARNLRGGAWSHYMKLAESLDSNESFLPQSRYALEESTPKCDSKLLEQMETPQLVEGPRKNIASIGSCKEQACDQLGRTESEEIMFVQSEGNARLFRGSHFDDDWSKQVRHCPGDPDQKAGFVSDCSSFMQDNLEALTPCVPFTELKKMFTPHTSLDKAPSKQSGQYYQNQGRRMNAGLDLRAHHAPCAALVLNTKNQLQQILHSEASIVLAALTSVIEKANILEMVNSSAMLNQQLNTCLQTAAKDLKESIEQAAVQIASLEQAVLNLWHALGPEALVAPSASLTEQDATFAKSAKEQSVLTSSSTQAWKQCLDRNVEAQIMTDEFLWRRTDAEERRLSGISDWSIDTSTSDLSCTEQHQGVGTNVVSAIQCVVKKTVDDFMAPLDERGQAGEGNCPEMVIEQLLSELENAAAKVAKMEVQMKILRDSINASERKRKKAEQNLAKAQQSSFNQLVDKWCKASDIKSEDLTSVRNAEGKLAVLKDACRVKDNTIARLEEEIAELQTKISDLTIQTPHAARQNNQFSKPTLVASNLLFNLDSPIKVDSPQSGHSNSLWKGLDELSRVSDSQDKGWIRGKTGNKYQFETHTFPTWNHELNKESGCSPPDKLKQSVRAGTTDANGNGVIRFKVPKVATSHARKLKFSSVDSRFSEDKRRNSSSEGVNRVGRKEGNVRTSISVLAGVELNTPIRTRKFGMKDREQKTFSSADNMNRAKENSKRRRWM